MNAEYSVILFGLTAAVAWGTGDFAGGISSKKSNAYGVVLVSQIFAALILTSVALYTGEQIPPSIDLFWGFVAGIGGFVGILSLYQGLSSGKMGVVAPVSGVVTALIPVLFGITIEGLPSNYNIIGFIAAILAVWLLSANTQKNQKIFLNDLKIPIIAGIGFGVFLILIGHVSQTSIFWPIAVSRYVSALIMIGLYFFKGNINLPAVNLLPFILLAAFGDAIGNIFYALATEIGRLDIAAIISSMYPAATIFLAYIFLREHIQKQQFLGIIAALFAIILISM